MESAFLLKPEAVSHFQAIQKILEENGLKIVCFRKLRLSKKLEQGLYPNLSREVQRINERYLIGRIGIAGLVRGRNAIEKLVKICGEATDPMQCKEGTIRHLFGRKTKILLHSKGRLYKLNAIHRARTEKEVKQFKKLFFKSELTTGLIA